MDVIEVDGASLAYHDTGSPKAAAPTLLLVHGFPLSHAMWRAQIDDLRDACRVVAPDLRGYGASSLGGWPVDDTVSLARYADDLAALIDQLKADGPVVFAGFSMGGYTAFAMLQRHSDLFDALVLIDTRAANDTDEAKATRLKMAEKVGEWGAARVAEVMRPKLFAPDTEEAIVQQTVELIASADPAAIAASQRAMAARPDSTETLPAIGKSTLVVAGEHDALTPAAEMRGIAEAIPGARYVEIEAAGHMAPVEKPEAVNAALRDFVSGLSV